MKTRSIDDALLEDLAHEHGTPLYVYDGNVIRERVRSLAGFDRIRYAQKANPNLSVLRLLREEGALIDAVSAGEIRRALAAGFEPHEIVFTADLFDGTVLDLLGRYSIHANLGSRGMIQELAEALPGSAVTLRVNPGFGHGHGRGVVTGGLSSKHGIWFEDLDEAVAEAAAAGLVVTGLHVHIGSGSSLHHLLRSCDALRAAARQVGETLKIVSAGGGLPIPYREDEERLDLGRYAEAWGEARRTMEAELGRELLLEVEPGRYLVGEAGYLLCSVRATKSNRNMHFAIVDAGFNNLVRPALYGAYHHISVVRGGSGERRPTLVAGPLCESMDIFTQSPGGELDARELPALQSGDLVCIHDVGAYGASMASNYNSRPLAAEVLVQGRDVKVVRRRQSWDAMLRDELDCLAVETPPEEDPEEPGPAAED